MNDEKRINAPRQLWDRLRAMMERDGFSNVSEAVRHCVRVACDESERRSDK